jgi:tetratricopeptide (TPR) repeat protein
MLLQWRWRWNDSERDFRQAIALDPRSSVAHQWYGEQLMSRSRFPEAVATLKRAAELDPVSPVIASSYALALGLAGRDPQAIAQARRAVELDSTLFLPRLILGYDHLLAKRTADAIRELEPALGLSRESPHVQGILGYAYAAGGQRQNAEAMAQTLGARSDANSQAALSVVLIGLGDTARALTSLERAARAKASFLTVQPLGANLFDPVRASPRFAEVLRIVGLR